MSLTIIQKSDLSKPKPRATKALVLSGGAVTGGSFMGGGLKALNEYFDGFTVNDFDLFVGISSGSLIAAPLAGGISPEEMLRSLDGTSRHFLQLAPWHCYWPNWREFVERPIQLAKDTALYLPRLCLEWLTNWSSATPQVLHSLFTFAKHPTNTHYTALMNVVTASMTAPSMPQWMQLIPTGLFDNAPIEKYLRRNIERNHLTNNFQMVERVRGKRLYICAMALDTAKRVVFGPDENHDVTLSEAVQASTALPIFYRPARIRGVDYVDGGVFETSHIDVAVAKGAQLIVCYNPFRPVENQLVWEYIQHERRHVVRGQPLSSLGFFAVLNQIFRAVFHTRLQQTLQQYRANPAFAGDIIVIEPRASDMKFFELNPMLFSHRIKAAQLGFESVRNSIDEHFEEIAPILGAYGIRISRQRVEGDYDQLQHSGENEAAVQQILERPATPKRRTLRAAHAQSRKP